MPQIPSTPQHCPGFQPFKDLKSFACKCNRCGATKEIFSDEFDREHVCSGCGKPMDFSQCSIEGEARSETPE